MRQLRRQYRRLHLEYLPAYAPELNPDEGVWASAKHSLANGRPDDLDELEQHLQDVLHTLCESQATLRACIYESELPLFLC